MRVLGLLTAVLPLLLAASPSPDAERPNIVLIMCDDMGWSDLSCFGGDRTTTENIDRLASEGIKFTQFYVNSPICSPWAIKSSAETGPASFRLAISSSIC